MVSKGRVSAVAGGGKAVTVTPYTGQIVTAELVVPWFLIESLSVGDPVIYAVFEDNTGIVLHKEDGAASSGSAGGSDPGNVGNGVKIVKLYENGSPSNTMGATTLQMDLLDYDGVSIYFKNKNNGNTFLSTGIIPVGSDFTLFYITSDGASQRRAGSVTERGIVLETGYAGSAASTACCIPIIVYGYKGIS